METGVRRGSTLARLVWAAAAGAAWAALFQFPVARLIERADPSGFGWPSVAALPVYLVSLGLVIAGCAGIADLRGWRRWVAALPPSVVAGLVGTLATFKHSLKPGLFGHPEVLGEMAREVGFRTIVFMVVTVMVAGALALLKRMRNRHGRQRPS